MEYKGLGEKFMFFLGLWRCAALVKLWRWGFPCGSMPPSDWERSSWTFCWRRWYNSWCVSITSNSARTSFTASISSNSRASSRDKLLIVCHIRNYGKHTVFCKRKAFRIKQVFIRNETRIRHLVIISGVSSPIMHRVEGCGLSVERWQHLGVSKTLDFDCCVSVRIMQWKLWAHSFKIWDVIHTGIAPSSWTHLYAWGFSASLNLSLIRVSTVLLPAWKVLSPVQSASFDHLISGLLSCATT